MLATKISASMVMVFAVWKLRFERCRFSGTVAEVESRKY